jgi:hypothetical protein
MEAPACASERFVSGAQERLPREAYGRRGSAGAEYERSAKTYWSLPMDEPSDEQDRDRNPLLIRCSPSLLSARREQRPCQKGRRRLRPSRAGRPHFVRSTTIRRSSAGRRCASPSKRSGGFTHNHKRLPQAEAGLSQRERMITNTRIIVPHRATRMLLLGRRDWRARGCQTRM